MREAILALGSETYLMREPRADQARLNLMRLDDVPVDDPSKRFLDAATGAIIAVHVPNPPMPAGSTDEQLGTREGSLGRLLPGLVAKQSGTALVISGLAPGSTATVTIPDATLDPMGFIVPIQV